MSNKVWYYILGVCSVVLVLIYSVSAIYLQFWIEPAVTELSVDMKHVGNTVKEITSGIEEMRENLAHTQDTLRDTNTSLTIIDNHLNEAAKNTNKILDHATQDPQ